MTMRILPRNTAHGVVSGIGSEIEMLGILAGLCTAMAEAALGTAPILSSCWEFWDALWVLLVLPMIRFPTSPSKMSLLVCLKHNLVNVFLSFISGAPKALERMKEPFQCGKKILGELKSLSKLQGVQKPFQCCKETSSAQYIVQQYMAATGCLKFQNSIKSSYIVGRVKMVSSEAEMATKACRNYSLKASETGCFVLWQMMPDTWSVELVLGGSKVHAGSNGKIVWRHTPWLGSHAAKGPPRPLRRALQGLDPRTTAIMFANARCLGEKKIGDEDCFILKLAADPSTLHERSDGPAEIIRHVLFGYFSQKTGLLVYLEDSHLTRIQATGIDVVYWETTIETTINNYRAVDGVMIAHSGRSVVTLFKFGECSMSHTRTRMEETWTIDDVVFNVPGLSMDFFIPPADIIKSGSGGDACNYQSDGKPMSRKPQNGILQQVPVGGSKCMVK